jgi:uncharacterized membrane protein YidH (DUF202 family)
MTPHRFDPVSFVAGVVVVAFALFFLTGTRTPTDVGTTWLWPVLILTPGALLVLGGVRRVLEDRAPRRSEGPDGSAEDRVSDD